MTAWQGVLLPNEQALARLIPWLYGCAEAGAGTTRDQPDVLKFRV